MKLLLAEDDPYSSALIVDAVRRLRYEVVVVDDGLEAEHRLLEDRSIRLVISDWVMPGLDGLELCRRLREWAGPFYTYFILITARTGLDARLEGYRAGVDDFLTKPLHLDELLARVEIARRILEMQEGLVRRSLELEALKHELEERNARLADMAVTDALTGLRNRRHFHRLFESNFLMAAESGLPLTVILLDVDGFKRYNDTFGHPAGDEVLVAVAEELRRNVRDRDLIARYGGEEFVVLLPRAGAADGVALAERLRQCIAGRSWPVDPITASFGVATLTPASPTPSALLDQADRALYSSKQRGRNCVTHYRDLGPRPDRLPVIAAPAGGPG
ncbi:GGDEF domain-containing response regulator [Tautonia sociabilis]|uniref:diguanylate cyclase n=1 Tax=Tautonia sociabilis TaxID=2080755 RepID=A0A432MJK6_9BACT|nr:diguanylate cyclase [Tautonia sociabilis]RUL87387.1 diguanylate cyclase [Tautonia sociabilis]